MSLISAETASAIIAFWQFVFTLALLPTIVNKDAQVPRKTSGLTATGLWCISLTYLLMGPLWLAVLAGSLSAASWTFVFVLRPVRSQELLEREGYILESAMEALPKCSNVEGCYSEPGMQKHGPACARACAFHELEIGVVGT